MKSKVRIGIVGTGAGMRTHFPAFKDLADIVGIVGQKYGKTKEIAEKHGIDHVYSDYRALCDREDIDLVIIATPNDLHFEQVKYAIKKGKHVLAEKPLVLTIPENEELISLEKEAGNGRLLLVNHQLRFNPYMGKIREIIGSNSLGEIYHAHIFQQSSAFSKKDMEPSWSFERAKGGGVRWAMGSHLLDLVGFLFPNETIERGMADSDSVIDKRNNPEYRCQMEVSSFFIANLSMDSGMSVLLSTNAASLGKSEFSISIYGTDGEIHFDLENKLSMKLIGEAAFHSVEVDHVKEEELKNEISIFRSSFKHFAGYIISCIEEKNGNTVDYAPTFKNSLQLLRILEGARKSNDKKSSPYFELN
ncbi:MAG: Gfo/Idh/MocA family protein [Flavobacteriaceae bacterium]